jgi:hypothetical protein
MVLRPILLAAGVVVGCGTRDTGSDLDPVTVDLAGACDMASDFGGFVVQSAGDNTGVEGKVADGVVPISVLEEIGAAGECRLLRRNNPFCDPACDRSHTCDFDGVCVAYPANQDLGVVTIAGLAQDVAMDPIFPGNTYFDTSLPDPPFAPGELITLDMPDGVYGPLTLHGVGLELLTGTADEWIIEEGRDLVVTWAPPTTEVVRSTVGLSVSIDQHGATPGLLRCDFADDGEGVVPEALIGLLINSGVTGFPTGRISRNTVDSGPVGDGCMDLTVAHPFVVDVDVVGYTPCISTQDCPDGQECNLELQICE